MWVQELMNTAFTKSLITVESTGQLSYFEAHIRYKMYWGWSWCEVFKRDVRACECRNNTQHLRSSINGFETIAARKLHSAVWFFSGQKNGRQWQNITCETNDFFTFFVEEVVLSQKDFTRNFFGHHIKQALDNRKRFNRKKSDMRFKCVWRLIAGKKLSISASTFLLRRVWLQRQQEVWAVH